MKTVIITGGTGLIGKQLSAMLIKKGYNVIIFSHSRQSSNSQNNLSTVHWDIATGEIDKDAVARADYIVHLAGAGVADKRWTKERKREMGCLPTKGGLDFLSPAGSCQAPDRCRLEAKMRERNFN